MFRCFKSLFTTAPKMAYQPAIMSTSLGRPWLHDFEYRMEQASVNGIKGMEMVYEDIEYVARKLYDTKEPDKSQVLAAASHCQKVCQRLGLTIICLQPFSFYEGLKDREQHAKLIEKFKHWLQVAKILKTDIIQVPSNFLPEEELTDDLDVIASDLRELADLALAQRPVIRLVYENLCFGAVVSFWETVWDIVERVDRENFGVCLDTFNIAGSAWADPADPSGMRPDADNKLKESLQRMVGRVDVKKVMYVQVVDAERMKEPLVEGHPFHVQGHVARMDWSRNARLFMYEEDRGAYLPVEQVAKTIFRNLGYKGFVSMELFSRTLNEEGDHVPRQHARRAMASWDKLVQRLSLQ